jgi:hypothetical protein
MTKGFFSVLFIALTGYGIWLQQSYMELYSQEFDMQLKADRTQSTLFHMKEIEAREFKGGKLNSIFTAGDGNIKNNGHFVIGGKTSYILLNGDGTRRATINAPRAIGEAQLATAESSLFEAKNRITRIFFPQDVSAHSGPDHIRGRSVKYSPETRFVESASPIEWNGDRRDFSGVGFTYNMDSGDLRVGGPIRGNFIPEKDDFSSFGKKR